MTIEVISEVWNELRRYVNTVDREEAAETVVATLIDHDYDAEDIRAAFKGDTEIKKALAAYINSHDTEEEYEDYDEDEEEDWDE